MVLFQNADSVWWTYIEVLLVVMTAAAIWFFVIIGRDRMPRRQRRGEETIERYGDIEEDRAPVPLFLMITYIGAAVWALGYLLYTGFHSLF